MSISSITYIYIGNLFVFHIFQSFCRWFYASSKSRIKDRENDAIENIRYYFSHVTNAVSMVLTTEAFTAVLCLINVVYRRKLLLHIYSCHSV